MKFIRAAILALLAFAVMPVALRAQEPAKPAPAEQKHAQTPAEPGREKNAEPAQTGIGAQLAETSEKAAGEEDETAQFKESGSVRWIASVTGLSLKSAYWVAIAINFVIIAIAVIFFARAKVPAAFRSRTAAIQKGMEEARRAGEEARQRLGEIEQRLSKLDSEIASMTAAAESEAAAEEARIREAAEADKRKIVEMAEQEISAAMRAARRELKGYTADLAVALAEKRIQVDSGTDQALVRSFTDQLAAPTDGKESR